MALFLCISLFEGKLHPLNLLSEYDSFDWLLLVEFGICLSCVTRQKVAFAIDAVQALMRVSLQAVYFFAIYLNLLI